MQATTPEQGVVFKKVYSQLRQKQSQLLKKEKYMYHIIVNPAAGRGQSLKQLPYLTKLFDDNSMAYEVYKTTAPIDAYEKARAICTVGSDGIIGIGGDGTIQEIVAGMAEAFKEEPAIPIPLALFPCGSGNDFAITLERAQYKKKKGGQAAKTVFDAVMDKRLRTVDLIKADGMAFLNIGNIGLDARIVKNAMGFKKKFGHYAYLAAVYKSIIRHKNLQLTIEAGNETLEGRYALAAMCNGCYYGGGLPIAPHAIIDDAQITLCLVDAISRPMAMVLFPTLLFSLHTKLKQVRYLNCKSLTITLPHAEVLCLDGNLYEKSGNIKFEIIPKALQLFT